MPVSDGRGAFRGLFTPREPDAEGYTRSFPSLRWCLPRSSFNAREVQDVWRRVDDGRIPEARPGNISVRANIAHLLMPGGFMLERSVSWDPYTPLYSVHAPPTFPEILDSLNRHEATDEDASTNEDVAKRKRCAICLAEFTKGDILATGPCTHRFHDICLAKWLVEKNTCPTCRIGWLRDSPSYTRR